MVELWGGSPDAQASVLVGVPRGEGSGDVYEIAWSADVTPSSELRRASLDEIAHVGTTWDTVS
jgi:hypothetical protein